MTDQPTNEAVVPMSDLSKFLPRSRARVEKRRAWAHSRPVTLEPLDEWLRTLRPDVRTLCEKLDGLAGASYRKLLKTLEQEAAAPTPRAASTSWPTAP